MVRVISVHHFTSQNVQTVEQPTACTTVPPDRILLALMSNCVEVRDLKNNAEVLFTFPTVDEVAQIYYSLNGDYVATLESKFNRQNKETNFVRVYINWNSIATMQQSKMTNSGVSLGSSECGMVQPMRARIAGRVTPTSNQSDLGSLEMIEIPVKKNPHHIACCPMSGNLLIVSESALKIYKFKVKTHDISRMKFIDFEDVGVTIKLTFQPIMVDMCENYIAAMNKDNMHLFKLCKKFSKESSTTVKEATNDAKFQCTESGPIDYELLLKKERCHPTKDEVTINLPSVLMENSLIHKQSPFTFCDKEMTATLSYSSTSSSEVESKLPSFKVINLIQLRLVPILIENAQRHITEEFKTFVLKPSYIEEIFSKSNRENDNVLRSDYTRCLNSVSCTLATQQEGYLFHFGDTENSPIGDNCIAVYPFTAPVFQVVVDDYFLHALTETGLESYTLRSGHKIFHDLGNLDNIDMACPPIDEGICLVGLRPFLGVEQILLGNNHLILLANADISPTHSITSNSSSNAVYWTLYSLELPTPDAIFNDFSIVANIHRFTSPQTYCHLMNEAHMILRVSLLLTGWTTTGKSIKLVKKSMVDEEHLVDMFKESCALLGDHYVMFQSKEQYMLAVPYYRMARIPMPEVIKRVRKIQEQSNSQFSKGLIYFLKFTILDARTRCYFNELSSPSSKQSFLDECLVLLEEHALGALPRIILKCKILKDYSTDKLIKMLTKKVASDFPRPAETHLALCFLYIKKNNLKLAEDCLEQIDVENLDNLLHEHWEILFERETKKGITNFSELGDMIISRCPERFADLLVSLVVEKKAIQMNRLIKVLLEYIPSSIATEPGTSSRLLQRTLEGYLRETSSRPENTDLSKSTNEALKILVRCYISQLHMLQMTDEDEQENPESKLEEGEETDEEETKNPNVLFDDKKDQGVEDAFLFAKYRHEYLKKMPPYQVEVVSKMYEKTVEGGSGEAKQNAPNEEADLLLAKLQAVLCSPLVSDSVKANVDAFLSFDEKLRGEDALRSIILSNKDAVQYLLERCPQCLAEFGKNRFTTSDEWKFLIAGIQQKILELSQDENLSPICFFYKKLLKDVLSHVATSMTMDELTKVLPQKFSTNSNAENSESDDPVTCYTKHDYDILKEIHSYGPYLTICKETAYANVVRKMIVSTGQQLLRTLDL